MTMLETKGCNTNCNSTSAPTNLAIQLGLRQGISSFGRDESIVNSHYKPNYSYYIVSLNLIRGFDLITTIAI
jgi:hypothetical protein